MPNYKTRKDRRTTVSLRDDLHGKLRAIAFVRGPGTNLRDVVDEAVDVVEVPADEAHGAGVVFAGGVLVIGLGPIGLMALKLARAVGAEHC